MCYSENWLTLGSCRENELHRQNEDRATTTPVAWKCPACGAAQTQEYAECPQCGVIVAKFQRKQSEAGEAEQYPESSFSQPSPLSVDAPSGGWAELETGNGRFTQELSATAHVERAAAPVIGRPSASSQFPDYQEDYEVGTDDESESMIPEPQTLDRSGWIILLVCPIVALVCMVFFSAPVDAGDLQDACSRNGPCNFRLALRISVIPGFRCDLGRRGYNPHRKIHCFVDSYLCRFCRALLGIQE